MKNTKNELWGTTSLKGPIKYFLYKAWNA